LGPPIFYRSYFLETENLQEPTVTRQPIIQPLPVLLICESRPL
jgi:hypothetical protein